MSPHADETPRSDIDEVLDAFHAAARRADETALLARFAAGGVFLGTDATERWAGQALRDFVHARFAGGTGWTMSSTRRDVTVRGDAAWFDEDLVHTKYGALRGSGVAARGRDRVWRIELYDLSVTVPNERFEAVSAVLRGGGGG